MAALIGVLLNPNNAPFETQLRDVEEAERWSRSSEPRHYQATVRDRGFGLDLDAARR